MIPPRRKTTKELFSPPVSSKPAGTTQRSGGKLIQRRDFLPEDLENIVMSPRADSIRELIGSAPDEVYDLRSTPYGKAVVRQGGAGMFMLSGPGDQTPFKSMEKEPGRRQASIGLLSGSDKMSGGGETFPAQAFAHEMGHYANYDERNTPIKEVMQNLPPITPNYALVSNRLSPLAKTNDKNYQSQRPLVDKYAVEGGEQERRAQAFANAFDYLQRTASDTTDWRGRIGAAEATTPGMGDIARVLMAQPLYSKHPLKKQIR